MSRGAQQLLRIERNTGDLDRAVAFYCDALGFCKSDGAAPAWMLLPGSGDTAPRCAVLSLGAQTIVLTEFPDAAPYPAQSSSCDLWFQHCAIVVDDMQAAHDEVMRRGGTAITQHGPQTLPPSTGAVTCFKFRDPDGHPLELIAFPPGAGDPCWQSVPSAGPTLGMDHSAISVRDVERSLRFYELLGLHAAARGVNRGSAQDRLDDLADVEVDVVAMQAAVRTPHLELLCYREPQGRAISSVALTAIAADRLVWKVEGLDALLDALRDAGFANAIISSGLVEGALVAMLRDPDGHLMDLSG